MQDRLHFPPYTHLHQATPSRASDWWPSQHPILLEITSTTSTTSAINRIISSNQNFLHHRDCPSQRSLSAASHQTFPLQLVSHPGVAPGSARRNTPRASLISTSATPYRHLQPTAQGVFSRTRHRGKCSITDQRTWPWWAVTWKAS